jgi:predicted deacylase
MLEDVSLTVLNDAGQPVTVRAWRLGGGDGPRVHLQAGVHADEIAGMLVLHKLLPRLRAAHDAGRLRGTVTVVPQANPLGLTQFCQGRLVGRFHEATNRNFNRQFIESAAAERPASSVAAWQKALLGLALDAQIVLDLHTDAEALPYVYVHQRFWPAAADLVGALAPDLTIVWDDEEDSAFEGAVVSHWVRSGQTEGRLVATLELRGQSDVSDALAERDAEGLYAFLCGRGVIDDAHTPAEWRGDTVPISHMETVLAPAAGIVVYERALGARLEEGERFARIVARPGDPASEHVLYAPQAGRLATMSRERLIVQGEVVAKLTGSRQSAGWAGGPLDP